MLSNKTQKIVTTGVLKKFYLGSHILLMQLKESKEIERKQGWGTS